MRQPCCLRSIVLGLVLFSDPLFGASPPSGYKLVLQAPPAVSVNSVAVSPDGSLIATASGEGGVRLYDAQMGALLRTIGEAGDRGVVFAPNGRTLTAAGFHMDKLVGVFDVQTGKRVLALPGHTEWEADATAVSPDGKLLASTGTDKQILVWELATGKLRLQLRDQAFRSAALAFSPDSAMLASGGGDKLVRLWDATTGELRRSLAGHRDWATGKVEWQAPGYFEQVNSVALSEDAAILVTGSSDHRFARGRLQAGAKQIGPGAVRLWDARTGRMLRSLGDPAEQVMAVAISSDGKRVASGAGIEGGKGAVHVWDAETGVLVWSMNDHVKEVLAVAFGPDGNSLAIATADGLVKICDSRTGSVSRTLADHKGGATSLAFSQDGNALFCGQGHGGARIWDARSGRLLQSCKPAGSQAESFTSDRLLNSIGLSRDGGTLATCASSVNNEFVDPVRLWDARTGALQRDFAAEKIHGRPMALSPNGSILATGGKSIKLWDVHTGKMLRELFGHLKRTQSIAFSADGRLLVSGGSYGTTNAWEVATGRHLVTLFAFSTSRNGTVADDWLAYHPDGYYDGSSGVERYLAWRVGDELQTPDSLGQQLHRPDRIDSALKLGFPKSDSP